MRPPDVMVVGGGVIGLAVAVEAGRRGLTVTLFDAGLPGGASRAAAGLIAPTLGTAPPGVTELFTTAAAGYSTFLESLAERGGGQVPIGWGVLEVAATEPGPAARSGARGKPGHETPPGVTTLDAKEVAELEPELVAPAGGSLHALDGWLEPGALVDALAKAARHLGTVELSRSSVQSIHPTATTVEVKTEDGALHGAPAIVVAAGAWSPQLGGMPSSIPVSPARGQLLSFEGPHALRHAVDFADRYLVPRNDGVIIGSTMERVGFAPVTTPEGLRGLEDDAKRVIPGIVARSSRQRGWAGLRPVTPDLLPIIDRDPRWPRVIYACGHSKNGVLLAPLSAQAVVAMLLDEHPPVDTGLFALRRFGVT